MLSVVRKKDRTYNVFFGDQHESPETFEVWNNAGAGGILRCICADKYEAERIVKALNLLRDVENSLKASEVLNVRV